MTGIEIALAVMAIAGAAAQISAGQQQAKAFKAKAAFDRVAADQEALKGLAQGNELRRDLIKDIAATNVRFGAAGIDLSSGTIKTIKANTIDEAERSFRFADLNALLNKEKFLTDAQIAGISARTARIQGFGRALTGLASAGLSLSGGTPTTPAVTPGIN